MTAARSIRPEQRDAFLRLISQQLKIKDIDVADAIKRAQAYVLQAA